MLCHQPTHSVALEWGHLDSGNYKNGMQYTVLKLVFLMKAVMRKLTQIIMALALFLTVSSSKPAQAIEFGLTASTVYSIWRNINNAVLIYAKERSTDEKWLKSLENMRQDTFSGKVPANVLEKVKQFNIKLDELRQDEEAHSKELLLESGLSVLLAGDDHNRVTPSRVYLHSGQALIKIVEEILHISPIDAEISSFFDVGAASDKTPSDVFSLVELGLRYLDEILILQNTGDLTIRKGSR